MPIFNIFSKRQKKNRGEVPDVFQYKTLPQEFRVQVVHILRDALGVPYGSSYYGFEGDVHEAYKYIHDTLCREYGVFVLAKNHNGNYADTIFNFALETDTEKVLDLIELSLRLVVGLADNYAYHQNKEVSIKADDAIRELNFRFLEHGIGYQYESGEHQED